MEAPCLIKNNVISRTTNPFIAVLNLAALWTEVASISLFDHTALECPILAIGNKSIATAS